MLRILLPCLAGASILAGGAAVGPEALAAPPSEPARVGVFVVGARGAEGRLSPSRQATLLLTLERALEQDERLELVDKDRTLAERAGIIPSDVVSEARGLLQSGEALLRKKRPRQALLRLQAAARQLEGALAWVKKRQLARAQFLVGVAHAALGHKQNATRRFIALQVWRPDFTVDTTLSPGAVLPLWDRARKRVARLPGGSLEIRSSPDRALAYVDGRFVGFTPTSAEGLTLGTHYVTLRKIGYRRAILRTRVSSTREQRVRTKLARSSGAKDVSELVATASRSLGESRSPPAVAGLDDIFKIEHALFLRAPAQGASTPRYELFLYDTRARRLLARATARTTDDRGIADVFPELARAIYAQVSFAAPVQQTDAKRPNKPSHGKRARFYNKWWFWTGLSLVAAGAALPWLLPDRDSSPACPTGSVCGEIVISF